MKVSNKRNFILGDKWIYYKFYSGGHTADDLLCNNILKVSQNLIGNKIIDKWFFIRYRDPYPHIRYRLHITDINKIGHLIKIIKNSLNDFGDSIWKVSLDTYYQEIERYGEKTMGLSEDLFFFDSVMVAKFLNVIAYSKNKEEYRWLYCLKIIDSFLNSFKFSLFEKKEFTKKSTESLKQEYETSKKTNKMISQKYRDNKIKIEKVLKSKTLCEFETKVLSIINERKEKSSSTIDKILNIRKKNELDVPFSFLLSSYIHMSVNRIFKSKQRMNEMVCYEFLFKFYSSEIAKKVC